MSALPRDFAAHLAAIVEGRATRAERARFAAWLRDDAVLRAAYVRQMRIHALLEFRSGVSACERAPDESTAVPNPAGWRSRVRVRLALAAAVMFVAGLSWLWLSPPAGNEATIMHIVEATGATGFRAGESIALGQLKLAAGQVRFRLSSGADVMVAGPADIDVLSAMHLRVRQGRITAEIGPEAKGFVVETASARVVDLGTRFGVEVSADGDTDVVVFKGQVEVYDPARNGARLLGTLDAGDGMRLDRRQAPPRRISFVVQGENEGEWSTLSAPPSRAVITRVSDNLGLTETRRFYRVSVGGMRPGVPARHMQEPRWFPYDARSLPAWLEGADVVETFSMDSRSEGFQLAVTLARPALLCVFQDLRMPPPAWLTNEYTDSGVRLLLKRVPAAGDPALAGMPGSEQPFMVWTREVRAPGTVILGSPRPADIAGQGRMYGVAAKALPAQP